jgi:hypothetical protein
MVIEEIVDNITQIGKYNTCKMSLHLIFILDRNKTTEKIKARVLEIALTGGSLLIATEGKLDSRFQMVSIGKWR